MRKGYFFIKNFQLSRKVINTSYVDCYQIKYSNEENNHIFEKPDLANGNDHDTAVSDLYFSWKNLKKQYENVNCYLCVAWKDSKETDELHKILRKDDAAFFYPQFHIELIAVTSREKGGQIKRDGKERTHGHK